MTPTTNKKPALEFPHPITLRRRGVTHGNRAGFEGKPFVKRQKNDMADAEAIAEAASRPTMRFGP
jgi:hypothetical protein